jgi:hypothetical protein
MTSSINTDRRSQMKKWTLGISVAIALAALALAPVASGEGRVTVSRFPISFSFFNPCTNENVAFSGTALGLIDTTAGDDFQLFHAVEINVTGIGETTGTRYREVFSITDVRQGDDEGGPFAETLSIHSRLITAGGGNDLDFDIVFHQTITATGEVAVSFNRITNESCV